MAIVALAGDLTTTTSVALASNWPSGGSPLVVEADPTGGDLAAWFDMYVEPSLSSVVTQVREGTWAEIGSLTRPSAAGLQLTPAPAPAREAARAVAEAQRVLAPGLAAQRDPVTIADTGRLQPDPIANPFVAAASLTVDRKAHV